MLDALSTPRLRIVTLGLLLGGGLLAGFAASLGIDDNPPGILLAFLAAIAFILAFVHPWRSTRKFLRLLLAWGIGLVLFIILNILLDSAAQHPATPEAMRNLILSPTSNAVIVVVAMLCAAAPVVSIVGLVALYIRSRRQ